MTSVSSGTRLQLLSNGIPDHSAWAMTGQTSIIEEKNYAFRVPKVPVLLPLNQATDANQGAVGYATNGVAIFGPYNSGCCDATFEEIQTVDYCLGHPANGAYHYHYFSKENFIKRFFIDFRYTSGQFSAKFQLSLGPMIYLITSLSSQYELLVNFRPITGLTY